MFLPEIDIAFRLHHDGAFRWVRIRGRALKRDAGGEIERLIGTIKDITLQREAEDPLRLMAHAFASMRDGLVVVDPHWRVIEVNDAMCTLLGVGTGQLLGQSVQRHIDLGDLILDRLLGQDTWRAERVLQVRDRRVPVEVTATAVLTEAGAPNSFIIAVHDISARRSALARLERMATVDGITGLPNRAALEDKLQRRMERSGEPIDLGLLFIGLDGFKVVNDSFGHDTGDALLRKVGELLAQAMPPPAIVGRWGGDKFTVLLPDGSGEPQVRAAAQAVQDLLRKPLRLGHHEAAIGATLGAVLAPRDGSVPATLLRRAEAALYGAKEQCRGQLMFYDLGLEGDAQRRLRMLSLLAPIDPASARR